MKLKYKYIISILLIIITINGYSDSGVLIKKNDGSHIGIWSKDLKSIKPNLGKSLMIYKNDGTVLEIAYSDFSSIETYSENKAENEITSGQEIDLGLSVKWAGWNVGANSPEQYGGYYAWGETDEKSNYTKETYKYYNSNTGNYTNIGNDISGTQYDVATVKWGNGWRMPTKAEFEELADECVWETCIYELVGGYKITGPNGNSIFMPFSGWKLGENIESVGYCSTYWSCMIYGNALDRAWSFDIYYNYYKIGMSHDFLEIGHLVRAVRN